MKKFLAETYNGDVFVVDAIDKLDAYNQIENMGRLLSMDDIICLN